MYWSFQVDTTRPGPEFIHDVNYIKKAESEIDKASIRMKFLTKGENKELKESRTSGAFIVVTPGESGTLTDDESSIKNIDSVSNYEINKYEWKRLVLVPMLYYKGEGKIHFALFDTLNNSKLSNWVNCTLRRGEHTEFIYEE